MKKGELGKAGRSRLGVETASMREGTVGLEVMPDGCGCVFKVCWGRDEAAGQWLVWRSEASFDGGRVYLSTGRMQEALSDK